MAWARLSYYDDHSRDLKQILSKMDSTDSGDAEKDIKTMKLYSQVDRIYNELKEIGFDRDSPLNVNDVNKFDQYHYYGTEAMDHAIQRLSLGSGDTVLDVGSGLGGPARYLASRCKCHVLAVELQQDLHQTALDLTTRCGLADNVRHIHANFLTDHIDCPTVDVLVTWLVFLHITEKDKLFQRCKETMKSGGKMYIEDIFQKAAPSDTDAELIKRLYFSLDTREQYMKHLTAAGFIDIEFQDVTTEWTTHVADRAARYRAEKERHSRVHGEQVYTEQQSFYDAMDSLFTRGSIGGCIVMATAK